MSVLSVLFSTVMSIRSVIDERKYMKKQKDVIAKQAIQKNKVAPEVQQIGRNRNHEANRAGPEMPISISSSKNRTNRMRHANHAARNLVRPSNQRARNAVFPN